MMRARAHKLVIDITKALAEPTRCRMLPAAAARRSVARSPALLDPPGRLFVAPERPCRGGLIAVRREGSFHDDHLVHGTLDAHCHA
jgi:hypothetical protein